jgi:predicted DNA-binding protein (MmcQ/YjbR family)
VQQAQALRRLRTLVRNWPAVVETQSWGHPNWKRGARQFAALDFYRGEAAICFKSSPVIQELLLGQEHFFPAPYVASRGWVCRTLEEPLDWTALAELIRESYDLVAPPPPKRKAKRPTSVAPARAPRKR